MELLILYFMVYSNQNLS